MDAAVYSQVIKRALAPLTDLNNRFAERMVRRGVDHRVKSRDNAQAVYADTRASLWTETWASFGSWSSGTNLQISGGRVYSTNGGGGASGINRAVNLGTTGIGRVVVPFKLIAGGAGNLMVGFTSDAAGGAFTAGGGKLRGIYFNSGGSIQSITDGTQANIISLGTSYAGDWVATLVADKTYLTVTVKKADNTMEARFRFARGSFATNNVGLFINDTRTTTGASFGPLAFVPAVTTVAPNLPGVVGTGIEGVGVTCHWSGSATASWNVRVPASYDPRVPMPVVVCFHGAGGDENTWADNANGTVVANALLAAGFIVVGASSVGNLNTWGAQTSLDAYAAAYRYVRDNFNIGPVAFYANSMGGVESLLMLVDGRIPGVDVWVGTSPTANLATNYQNATFTASFNGSYSLNAGTLSADAAAGATTISTSVSFPSGTVITLDPNGAHPETVTSTGAPTGAGPYTIPVPALGFAHTSGVVVSDYTAKTAGHDPVLMDARAFRGLPMLFLAATDDTSVPKAQNTDVLAAALTAAGCTPEVVVTTGITGGHSFDFTPYTVGTSAYDIVNFIRKYIPA